MNEIIKGARATGNSLFFEKEKALIIADLHLGFEEELNRQGLLVPRINFNDIKNSLKTIFQQTGQLKRIIINGDLKHEFGEISPQEWREALKTLDFLQENCQQIILIQGNHDKILGPLAERKKLTILKEGFPLRKGKILVLHGHELPEKSSAFKKATTLIIGHEHPAVSLREGSRVEKFKCFLKGNWQDKTLIVLPSFLSVTTGTDVLREELLSPFLQQDLSSFEAWLLEKNKTFYFGKLSKLVG